MMKYMNQLNANSSIGRIMTDKCIKCPECGYIEYTHKDAIGKGYRVCKSCFQEWWTDIDYKALQSASDVMGAGISGEVIFINDKSGQLRRIAGEK